MSGIAQQLVGNDLFQRFTADGTWQKPAGIKMVAIECIGGGGGGGAGQSGASTAEGGGGGGGAALARMSFSAESLSSTLTIDVGAAGAGGVGADPPNAGAAGSTSSVTDDDTSKVILSAFGGGGGGPQDSNTAAGGGAGGSTARVGNSSSGSGGADSYLVMTLNDGYYVSQYVQEQLGTDSDGVGSGSAGGAYTIYIGATVSGMETSVSGGFSLGLSGNGDSSFVVKYGGQVG